MKKQYKVISCVLLFTFVLFFALSYSVYGFFAIIAPLRSNFMKTTVIPLMTSSITFGGVAYSVHLTLSNNKKSEIRNITYEVLKEVEFEMIKRINSVRDLLSQHNSKAVQCKTLFTDAYFSKKEPQYDELVSKLEELIGDLNYLENLIILYLDFDQVFKVASNQHALANSLTKICNQASFVKSLFSEMNKGNLVKDFDNDGIIKGFEKLSNLIYDSVRIASEVIDQQWKGSLHNLKESMKEYDN